mgnify:CR=1 FL=1|jgi:spore coat protein CotH
MRYLINVALVALALAVTGCSSTPQFVPVEASMECVYRSDTTSVNGNVDIAKQSKCSTNPLEVYATAPPSIQCMYNQTRYDNTLTGRTNYVRVKRCRDQVTGNWYVVSTH